MLNEEKTVYWSSGAGCSKYKNSGRPSIRDNDILSLLTNIQGSNEVWLGGHRPDWAFNTRDKTNWIWSDGTPWGSYIWENGYPNGFGPCLVLKRGKLKDFKCGEPYGKAASICQKKCKGIIFNLFEDNDRVQNVIVSRNFIMFWLLIWYSMLTVM